MSEPTDDLVDALARIAAAADGGNVVDVTEELRNVPVALRAALAVTALSAADRPISGVTVAAAGGFSRGTAYRTNRDALDTLAAGLPHVVETMLARVREGESPAVLTATVQQRDATISALRGALREAEHDRDVALAYARDLHEQLAPEYRAILADKTTKVRRLRAVDPNDGDSSGAPF